MNILESLEQLNVSEECFNDIVTRIEEEVYDTVVRAEKKGIISPNKADSLKEKALKATAKEKLDSQNRDFAGLNKFDARERMDAKRSQVKNKTFDSLSTPESLCEQIIRIVEEYINELNVFTVGKVNALRHKAADDARVQLGNLKQAPTNAMVKNANKAIEKAEKNDKLSNKYVQMKTGNPSKNIKDVHKFTEKTGRKLISSQGDTNALDADVKRTVKDFQKAENRWAQKNPSKPKTGLVHAEHNPVYGGASKRYKSLNLDHVK